MYNKKQILKKFTVIILIFILESCTPVKQEIENNMPDNRAVYTVCDPQGELAMMVAPVVISQKNNFVECGLDFATIWTSIVPKDDAHSLANICDDKLFLEIYYSTNKNSLDNLQTLASNAGGSNFELPNGVGLLVESRSLTAQRLHEDRSFYIEEHVKYSPNRIQSKVNLPYFLANFNSRNISFDSNKFSNGQTVYYKWSKRIKKEGEDDPVTFSKETYSYTAKIPNSISAGNDKTITLPEQRSVVLDGKIVNNIGRPMKNIEWLWESQYPGARIAPTIKSPNNPETEIIFNDYGNHTFKLTATDYCDNYYEDLVTIIVRGQLDQNPTPSRNCTISSRENCANGLGSNFYIKNISNTITTRVECEIKRDLRSWQDRNTPGNGTVVTELLSIVLSPRQEIFLGCSVLLGSGNNGSDRGYISWTIKSEIPQ